MTASPASSNRSSRSLPCALCGGSEFEVVGQRDRRKQPLTTVLCMACGLIQHEHVPSQKELAEYYGREYRLDYKGKYQPSPQHLVREWQRAEERFARVQHLVRPGQRVFDIGGGMGCTVKRFELANCDASAIEPNDGFREYGIETLKARLTNGRLETLTPTPVNDIVLLVHVLEHLPWPAEALARIQRMLKPGGHLYLEVPNASAPHAAPGKMFHFAHIYNFTPTTLQLLAERCGLKLIKSYEPAHDANLIWLLQKSEPAQVTVPPNALADARGALRRANSPLYYFRPSYWQQRMGSLSRRSWESRVAPTRAPQIIARCQAGVAATRAA